MRKPSLDGLIRTKQLVRQRSRRRKFRNALLPATKKIKSKTLLPVTKKKTKPSLKSVGRLAKSYVKSKIKERKMHKMEVKRIHEERDSKMIHFKKKHNELLKMKDKKKQNLEKRLKSRRKTKAKTQQT